MTSAQQVERTAADPDATGATAASVVPDPGPSGERVRLRGARTELGALVVAEAISGVGTRITTLAVPWLVLVTTHDPVQIGIITAAATLPYVLNGFVAAPLVDRFGPRRMSIVADTVCAVAMGGVALGYHAGIVVLAILVAIAGAMGGVGDRAKNVLFKPLVQAAEANMVRMTSIYTGATRLSTLVGAGVGGVLIAWLQPWGAIWVDAISFLVCAQIVMGLVKPRPPTAPPPTPAATTPTATTTRSPAPTSSPAAREPYLTQLRGGFDYLRQDRLVLSLVSMLFVTNMFAQASFVVFLPIWVDTEQAHSAVALGAVAAAFSLGGLTGTLVFGVLATRLPRYAVFVAGYVLGGAPRFLILAFSHDLSAVVLVWFAAGVLMSSANPVIGAVMYERVPSHMLARVGGLCTAIAFAGFPIGGLLGGWLVAEVDLTSALVIAAGCYLIAALSPIAGYRTWRGLDSGGRRRTGPARPPRGALTVTVRYDRSPGTWSVHARSRAGAILAEHRDLAPWRALRALHLLDPPPLRPVVAGLAAAGYDGARHRVERIEADLADARHERDQLSTVVTPTEPPAGPVRSAKESP